MTAPARPFPLQPLADRLGAQAPTILRMSGSAWNELKEAGSLSVGDADRLAGRAGFHPSELWGDLWFSTTAKVA